MCDYGPKHIPGNCPQQTPESLLHKMIREFEREQRLKQLQWALPETLYLPVLDGQARAEVPGVLPEPTKTAPTKTESALGKCLNCAEYARDVDLKYLGRLFCPECGWSPPREGFWTP